MASQELIDYIIAQLNAGYDESTIEGHLIKHNYSKLAVDEAMDAVNAQLNARQQQSPHAQEQMYQPMASQQAQLQSSSQSQQTQQASQQSQLKSQTLQQSAVSQASQQQPSLPQADPQLVSFVIQQRNQGFTREQIKQYLFNYNYAVLQIDPALDAVFHPASTHAHISHLGAVIISAIVLVSVFSGAGLFFFFNNIGDDSVGQLLDYRVSTSLNKLFAGDQLSFDVYLENYGNDKRYDVALTHTVYDQDNNEIDTIQETAAVETNTKLTSKFNLDNNLKAGRYKVLSVGKYEDKEVSASFTFTVQSDEQQPAVEKPAEVNPPEQVQEETSPLVQQDSTAAVQEEPEQAETEQEEPTMIQTVPAETKPEEPITDPDVRTASDQILLDSVEKDVTIFAADPATVNKADELCQSLSIEIEQGYCYYRIAEVSKQKQFCDRILDIYERDLCLVNNFLFAENDFSVCSKIINYEFNALCKDMASKNIDLGSSQQASTVSDETAQQEQQLPGVEVLIQDGQFVPQQVAIAAGEEIVWTNLDGREHSILASDGSFDSGLLNDQESAGLVFDTAGSYGYISGLHPEMSGTIIVG